jgi:hypothetical protein
LRPEQVPSYSLALGFIQPFQPVPHRFAACRRAVKNQRDFLWLLVVSHTADPAPGLNHKRCMTGVNRKAIRPRYFGTSAQLWMNLQSKYDLAVAEDALRKQIEREVLSLSA